MPVNSQNDGVNSMPAQDAQQAQASKRKAVLSPELSEVLHMLKSLETEFVTKPTPSR